MAVDLGIPSGPAGAAQAGASGSKGFGWNPLTDIVKATTSVGSWVDAHTQIGSFNPGIGAFAASAANMVPGLVNTGFQLGKDVVTGHESEAGHLAGQVGQGLWHGFLDTATDVGTLGGLAPWTQGVEKGYKDVTGYSPQTLKQYATRPGEGLGGALFNDAANVAMLADLGTGALTKMDQVGKIADLAGKAEEAAKLDAINERLPAEQVAKAGLEGRAKFLAEETSGVADAGGNPYQVMDQVEARAKTLDRLDQLRTGAQNIIQPWHALRPFSKAAGELKNAETPPEAPTTAEGPTQASRTEMLGEASQGHTGPSEGTSGPAVANVPADPALVEQAKAKADDAAAQFQEVGNRYRKGEATKDELETARTQLEDARAAHTTAASTPGTGPSVEAAPPQEPEGPAPGTTPSAPGTAASKRAAISNWFTEKGQSENVPRAYASYLEQAKPSPQWVKNVVEKLPEPVVHLLQWMDAHSKRLDYQQITRQQQRALAVRAREIENRPEIQALFAQASELIKSQGIPPTVASNIVGQFVRAVITRGQPLIEALENHRGATEEAMPGSGSLLIDSQLGYSIHIPEELNTPEWRAQMYQLAEPYRQLRKQASDAFSQSEFLGDRGLQHDDHIALTKKELSNFNKAVHKLQKAAGLEQDVVPRQLAGLAKEKAWAEDQVARAVGRSQAATESMVDARTDFDRSRYVPQSLDTPEKLAAVADEVAERTVRDNGATYNPTTGKFLTMQDSPGYLVGALPHSVIAIPLDQFMSINPETGRMVGSEMIEHFTHGYQEAFGYPNITIGTWVDDSGNVHIDPTQFLEGPSARDHALTLAAVREQQTVKELHTGDDIQVQLDPNASSWFIKTHVARDARGQQLRQIIDRQIAKGGQGLAEDDIDKFMSFMDKTAVQQHLLHPDLYKSPDDFYRKAVKWEFAERANPKGLNETRIQKGYWNEKSMEFKVDQVSPGVNAYAIKDINFTDWTTGVFLAGLSHDADLDGAKLVTSYLERPDGDPDYYKAAEEALYRAGFRQTNVSDMGAGGSLINWTREPVSQEGTTFGLPEAREAARRINESTFDANRRTRRELLRTVEQINPVLGNAIYEYVHSTKTAEVMRMDAATRATPETEALVEAVNASPPSTRTLWRGMSGSHKRLTFNEGDTISMPLGSTTESTNIADLFTKPNAPTESKTGTPWVDEELARRRPQIKNVMVKVEPGTRALNLSAVSPIEEFEHLVSGDFTVTKVERNLQRNGRIFDQVTVVQQPDRLYEMRETAPVGQFVPNASVPGGTIRLFKNADLATLFHEGGHLLRSLTSDEDLAQIEEAFGVKGHKWTVAQEESFVHDFLAKASEVPALNTLKANLADVYGEFGGAVHPEVDSFWQKILNPAVAATRQPGVELSTGEKITGLEGGPSEAGKSMGQRQAMKTRMEGTETQLQQYRRGAEGQQAMDDWMKAAKQKRLSDAAAARAQQHVTNLEKMINERDVPINSTIEMLKNKGDAGLAKLYDKLDDPAISRVPARWQPMVQAAKELAGQIALYPELEDILGEFPQTFGQALDYAKENGIDPAYMPDLTPARVRQLIAGTAKLGGQNTREQGKRFISGARKQRNMSLQKIGGVDTSIEALVAGLNQGTQEARTNMIVDWLDRVAAKDLPTNELGRRLGAPTGWVEYDPIRRGMLGAETPGGERVAVGATKMIPRAVADAIKEYAGDPPTNPIYRALSAATNPWRSLMLTLNPGFYLKHFQGHILLAAISGGLDLKAWRQAYQAAREGYKNLPEVTGLNIAYAEGRTPGLVGYSDLPTAMKVGGPIEGAHYVADKMHKVIATTDSFARAVAYFSKVDKGATPMEALQYAMDAVIDYGNLSNTEKYWVRAIVPFYSFEKGVAKLVYRMPIDHPLAAAMLLHVGQWQQEQAVDDQGNPLPERYQGVVDLPLLGKVDMQKFSPFKDVSALSTSDGIVQSLQYGIQSVVRAGLGVAAPGTKATVKVDKYGRLVPDVSIGSQLVASFSGGPQGQVIQGGPVEHFFGIPTVKQDTLNKAGARNVLSQAEVTNADQATQQKAAAAPVDSLALQQNLRHKLDAGGGADLPTSPTGGQMFSQTQLQAAVQQAVAAQETKAKLTRASHPTVRHGGSGRRKSGRHSAKVRYRLRQGFGKHR